MLTSSHSAERTWTPKTRSAIGAGTGAALAVAAVTLAPPVAAERAPAAEQAIASARSATCGALRYNPTVERAADIINRSTYTYLNHTSENVPADDPHPLAITKDLGINSSKVISLQGAGHSPADAIKSILLEGYKDIPDCSYTDFGSSELYEEQSGFTLMVVVLVAS